MDGIASFAVAKIPSTSIKFTSKPILFTAATFDGVLSNQSVIIFQSSHLFCAIVAVVGVGGNSLGSIFAILRSRKLRMSALLDVDA